MSPKAANKTDDDMLPEYDFSHAVRGKYYERYRHGTNVVLLDDDVADVFRDSTAVNEALRSLIPDATVSRRQRRTRRSATVRKPTSRARSKAKSAAR